ncbi:MAG: zinc-binding dehydrogenase [Rhodospirillaceae bacterium]|nr:zinc-binding dehydrogenase [Rhodospirillaceae bacterium]MYF85042.1 zinc-binding dehydrogenase [Rhodospirillaceae bacterium]MYH38190.1 zinc-binding dehydrogenase [Rhodospirillaceae bacterium]MYK13742.1 zinc-binding dehydrogenase [Rhodospirillaceae bacterium]MYK59384.1 zinc-binding dehydrogenase [Rhodospirillaceae bacterium]
MRALRLIEEEKLSFDEIADPPPPGDGEALLRMQALSLNHIDLFGVRGMAFAKRALPLIVGVEGSGVVEAVGPGVGHVQPGDPAIVYPGLFCGVCRRCQAGQENLCEDIGGIMGFHVDGLARERLVAPAARVLKVPDGVTPVQAACTTVTFATVQHMLFDNAQLEPGETILVHAGGSGIGSTAIRMAKAIGCTVITTVGSADKAGKAAALGADHVIDYREERFEGRVRRLTGRQGVDVVFEHVGPDTWPGSLLSLKRGGRLVTCGSTSGVSAPTNLYSLFQQQLRIIGSFGSSVRNCRESLDKMAAGLLPVIDSEIALADFPAAIERLRNRDVFGKIVARF